MGSEPWSSGEMWCLQRGGTETCSLIVAYLHLIKFCCVLTTCLYFSNRLLNIHNGDEPPENCKVGCFLSLQKSKETEHLDCILNY